MYNSQLMVNINISHLSSKIRNHSLKLSFFISTKWSRHGILIFSVFGPKWEAWTAAPGFARIRVPGCSGSPRHEPCHCRRRHCRIFKWRILVWKQRTALGWHYKTFLPESSQTKGNNVAGKQFKESSEASYWRSRKRYTLTKVSLQAQWSFHIGQTGHTEKFSFLFFS